MTGNPLTKPIADWTAEDLDALRGATESEYLELKGDDVNISLVTGRSIVARAIAGLMGADGGYLIVGTTSGADEVEGYPGVTATPEEVDALRRSVLDRLRPAALLRGPQIFEAENEGKVVLVSQVYRHPAGLPAAADGIFWIRVGSETRRMDYEEIAVGLPKPATLQPKPLNEPHLRWNWSPIRFGENCRGLPKIVGIQSYGLNPSRLLASQSPDPVISGDPGGNSQRVFAQPSAASRQPLKVTSIRHA